MLPRDLRRASRRFFSSSSFEARIDLTAGMKADWESVSASSLPLSCSLHIPFFDYHFSPSTRSMQVARVLRGRQDRCSCFAFSALFFSAIEKAH